MSEISANKNKKTQDIYQFTTRLIKGEKGKFLLAEFHQTMETAGPAEIIAAFDLVMRDNFDITAVKKSINKVLNLLYKSILSKTGLKPKKGSLLDLFVQNNTILDKRLKEVRPFIIEINKNPLDKNTQSELINRFTALSLFDKQYIIKENILFPLLEKHWPDYRCLQIMWSYQEDIRNNIKTIIAILESPTLELKKFNRLCGDIFFNMYAIRFREEKILFPIILETIAENNFDGLIAEAQEIGFPYIQADTQLSKTTVIKNNNFNSLIDLFTGNISPEQIKLIFNHLPVDITFVDEEDTVCYFSTPKKRIFPRTKAIIGRKVQNCHPPESVDVVIKIIDAFKKGEKDHADFWLTIKDELILIQYFALHDKDGSYKGVIEVSQEVSDIKKLKGERRLLDW